MIFPILSYNSEVWRMYTKQDFKKWDNSAIEKTGREIAKAVYIKSSDMIGRAKTKKKNILAEKD